MPPIQPVEKPILCSPYVEPNYHWEYDKDTGKAFRTPGRRKAGYYFKTTRTGSAGEQPALPTLGDFDEGWDDLPLVNLLREDVTRWRDSGYRGASKITQELLKHWAGDRRIRRLFFCQREAVETVIYLSEVRIPGKSSRTRFKNFALTDENLQRLLKAERPEGQEFALASKDYFPRLMDIPLTAGMLPLRRLGCKMATGSGKTVVMAMLISWAFCNRGNNPASTEYPNAVLVCCPNLTVKERLQVLRPEDPGNYYAAFDLVPVRLRPFLQMGKVLVTNWHTFAEESEHKEGDRTYAVVNKGPETPETMARRVLKDLFERLPIMVLNDEGHHCWRPAPTPIDENGGMETPRRGRGRKKKEEPTAEEKALIEEEKAEARVWLEGLDRINNSLGQGRPGITMCVDLSATPFYLQGSGYPEGQPFPWLVSDFGLVDAIESGIVKIPRLPVKDDRGLKDAVGRPDPHYFRLWHNIVAGLSPSEKYGSGKPKPDACYRDVEGALKQLAGQWVERFEQVQASNRDMEQIPPVMIIVCDNTEIADILYRKISGESEADIVTLEEVEEIEAEDSGEESTPKAKKSKGKKQVVYGQGTIFPEYLSNTKDRKVTIRIDSKLLSEAESEGKNRQAAAEELRRVVSTVGRKGLPGENVRCVVSVSMLTEGWDANNVTHILGIRAFGSQLLCEQVVGRGLRRINYEPVKVQMDGKEVELLQEEYVDVYGIPFSVIPFKGRPAGAPAPEDRPKHRVWAVMDREEMEIKFPYVDGYVFEMRKGALSCDVANIDPLSIDPRLEPTTVFLKPTMGYVDTQKHTSSVDFIKQDRQEYYQKTHFQSILFQITHRIVEEFLAPSASATDKRSRVMRLQSRHVLFPQVFAFVHQFVHTRVQYNGVDPRELGVEKYVRLVVERIRDSIVPDTSAGEPPLLPILNRYRPYGSTRGVDFPTTRTVTPTVKSHINLVVQHSTWEGEAAKILDASETVQFYARNDHLGLAIKYEYLEVNHDYEPDFIVRLTNGLTLILEIKGYEVHNPEQTNAKHNAARRWVLAVNNLGDFGQWGFLVCREVEKLPELLRGLVKVG